MDQALRQEIDSLKSASADKVLAWAYERFGNKVALACSFGAEDMVLIDLMVRISPDYRIFTLDTGRLFQETYNLMDKTRKKYGIKIETFVPDTAELEEMSREKGYNPFYKSVEDRKRCCVVRKMGPLKRALATVDAWVCGLRQSQSVTRSDMANIEIDNNGKVKINPIIAWSEQDVWDYIKKHEVPYSKLHDEGFPSVGCRPCTRAVKEGEDVRAGRWWWESPETKECGLHSKK
ncbi:MAG: phosphoadenylyl-sulfate reductase [bacterium]